jgi:hypothetical protein
VGVGGPVARCNDGMGDEGRSHEGQGAGGGEEDSLFKVTPSYGVNPLPFPQEGEIGSGATPTFEPWEETGWQEDEGTVGMSNNRRTATALLEMNCVAVMGESTFSSGRHAWTVIIEVRANPNPNPNPTRTLTLVLAPEPEP